MNGAAELDNIWCLLPDKRELQVIKFPKTQTRMWAVRPDRDRRIRQLIIRSFAAWTKQLPGSYIRHRNNTQAEEDNEASVYSGRCSHGHQRRHTVKPGEANYGFGFNLVCGDKATVMRRFPAGPQMR